MNYLNLGCGNVIHQAWINLDVDSQSADVKTWDIRKGLPFADDSVDACYSSHVVEHLTPCEAQKLIVECFRVLKSDGVIRVVVPDLEAIAKLYLDTLAQIHLGVSEAELNYDWMMLELYDQTVRSCSGGEMRKYLATKKNQEFVRSRLGMEVENYWKQIEAPEPTIIQKLGSKIFKKAMRKFRISSSTFLVRLLCGREVEIAFTESIFRNSGELHKWMYDRFSITRMLKKAGFVDVTICQSDRSQIINFSSYNLDTTKDGKTRKPDSLFIEATKPT